MRKQVQRLSVFFLKVIHLSELDSSPQALRPMGEKGVATQGVWKREWPEPQVGLTFKLEKELLPGPEEGGSQSRCYRFPWARDKDQDLA